MNESRSSQFKVNFPIFGTDPVKRNPLLMKCINKLALVLCCVSFLFQNAIAGDSIRTKKVKILPVPVIGYSPETKTYVGVVSLFTLNFYQDSVTRSSNSKVEFNYTWNKQVIIETGWNYFFKDEAWFTQGLIHYSKYPDLYYGISDNTPESAKVNFESNRLKIDVSLLKQIENKWFAGMGFDYFNYSNVNYNEATNLFPELKNASNVGFKFILLKDSRNNILTPTSGNYFQLMNAFNFSESFYDRFTFDVRKYFSLGAKQNQVLSARFFQSSVFGTPPFYDYSLIGGDNLVRGYYYGRFRDKNLSTLQLEYRFDLFWKVGLATFGGVSALYPDFTSMAKIDYKPNYGIGLRFMVDKTERTNLRFDYALGGDNQSGFYVSFGESF